jgi:3-oxoacyl-[acyl-carrier protein] reductase
MDLQLREHRALVTGSSSGIGAGIARVLAAEGVAVAVHGRDAARAEAVAASLREGGAKAITVLGDLTDVAACERVAAEATAGLGGIDILVNNAGGKSAVGNPAWLEVGWDDWRATYEMNVGAAVRLIQHLAPGMRARGFGRIIQIASASGTQTEPTIGEYQAAKAGMINLTTSLARALAHTGITVNTVSPGTILTPAVERWLGAVAAEHRWGTDRTEIERRFTRDMIPLCADALGRPEDVGRVVALLASPLSGYICGANLRVDGGQCRSVN